MENRALLWIWFYCYLVFDFTRVCCILVIEWVRGDDR